MSLKKFYIILFFLLIHKGYSTNPKDIDTLKIHNQIKLFGLDEDKLKFKSHFFSSIVFKNDSTLFYNPNGTFYLFRIQLSDNPKVYKIALNDHSELNFNRYLFLYNDVLYSYGGQGGKFNEFPWLIYFDFDSKKWKKNNIKNYPYDVKKVLISWKINNKLKILLSHLSEKEGGIYSKNKNRYTFGEIDLEKNEYKEDFNFKSTYRDLLFVSKLGFFRGNYVYESKFYSIHGYYQEKHKIDYRIFDKRTGFFKGSSMLDKIKKVDGFSYVYIKDSLIYYKDNLGNIKTFNVEEGTTTIKKDYVAKYSSMVNNNRIIYSIIFIIISLFFLFTLIKKRKDKKEQKLIADHNVIEEKIKSFKSTTITKEKIDEIFGISHYSYETIKKRRSLIIKQLNKDGNIKILRVRKDNDKRYYDYKIN